MDDSSKRPSPVKDYKNIFAKLSTAKIVKPLLIFIVGIVVGYIFSQPNLMIKKQSMVEEKSQAPTVFPTSSTSFSPTVNENMPNIPYRAVTSCSKEQCLFLPEGSEYLEGFAIIRGYYYTYEATDWGDEAVTCKALYVTGGNESLINHFKKLVKDGNTINELRGSDLIMNISLDNLSSVDVQKIQASTTQNPIELGVIRSTPVGRGVNKCFSFVEIISVK